MAKRKKAEKATNVEILVGYVKHFKFNDKFSEDLLMGHPKEGRIYQIIKDDLYGYRLHVGEENTKDKAMSGILLGHELQGNYGNRWEFDVALINNDNYLDFDITTEDLEKLQGWLQDGNAKLKEVLERPVAVATMSENGELVRHIVHTAVEDALEEETRKRNQFSENLNVLLFIDPELFDVLMDVVAYLASTYKDKYEASGKPNLSKDYLLSASSSEVALFNSMKYLQRYSTTGFEKSANPKDLHKAIHYIIFEFMRSKRQNGK